MFFLYTLTQNLNRIIPISLFSRTLKLWKANIQFIIVPGCPNKMILRLTVYNVPISYTISKQDTPKCHGHYIKWELPSYNLKSHKIYNLSFFVSITWYIWRWSGDDMSTHMYLTNNWMEIIWCNKKSLIWKLNLSVKSEAYSLRINTFGTMS